MGLLDKLFEKRNYTINSLGTLVGVKKGLKRAQIPAGVTRIGKGAFKECCETLKSVTIPEGVTHIEEGAFASCKILAEITLPDSLVYIGDEAFMGCNACKEIAIPDSVTYIGHSVFSEWKLVKIKIPSQIKRIPQHCCFGCKFLKEVAFPDAATHIGKGAFFGCENLEKITIPDGVTHIEEGAFQSCENLKEITIPDSVSYIGAGALFPGYGKALTVHYKGTEEQWAKIQKEFTTIYSSPFPTSDTKYTVSLTIPSLEKECAELEFRVPEILYHGKEVPTDATIQREFISKIIAEEHAREEKERKILQYTYNIYPYTFDNCKIQFNSK